MTTQWIFLSLLLIGVNFLNLANAEDSSQDWYKKAEIQRHEFQLQIEKSELELKKMELERLKMDAEYKKQEAESTRLSAETQQLIMLNEASDREKELNDRMEQAEQSLQEHEAAAKEAEESANEAQSQIEQAEVRHKNQFYLGVFILTITIFLWGVVKKSKKEIIMKDYEKYGIIIILSSMLLILFAIMISDPWVDRYDFVQNIMAVLRISLFVEGSECIYDEIEHRFYNPIHISTPCTYLIDFPTKYAVLALLTSSTYGFTTYLGITPAYKMDWLRLSDKKEEVN